ncbi:MAG: ABC transporter substrate-binding protein [Candidatus Bipolaricaulia bacterium]
MGRRWSLLTILLLGLVLLASSALSGSSSSSAPQPVYGGTLVVAEMAEPPGLDPTTNAAAAIDRILQHNLYEGLVKIDNRGNILPGVAERWEVSPDGLEYTFHLRRGVKFHNGRELVASDIKFTFERDMDPATGHPHPEYYANIAAIEVLDDYTVRFRMKVATPGFLYYLTEGDSIIVPKEAVATLASQPVGTGPFKFVEWVRGDHITLAKFADYYKKELPYLDKVSFKFISDPSSSLAALQAGNVDVIILSGENVPTVEADPNLKIVSGPQNLVQIMAINNAREPFSDVRVRRAICHALDREKIIEGAMFGYGTPIGSHLTPVSPYYADMLWVCGYDPAKAKELLAEAGYPNGFKAKMKLPQPYEPHIRTGEIIADQLKEVGIELELEIIEWGRWLSEVYTNADYDLTVIGHIGRLDPAAMLSGYGPARPDYYYRRGYSNPDLDELMVKGETTVDEAQRKVIYTIVQWILAKDVVNYFIQDPHLIMAMQKNVENWRIFPIYLDDVTEVYKSR